MTEPVSRRSKAGALLLIVALAAGFRVHGLSSHGFSEDEVAKIRAIDAYRAGQFSANAEHPMLMKLVVWGSLSAAEQWNRLAPAAIAVAPETALRLPNALTGAATSLLVHGVASVLFGTSVGLVAAFIVATDPTVIAINRIGKEDTLLMFFFLLAVFCYERAKAIGALESVRAQSWYTAAGASFGLMLASKYLPHLFGVYGLYNVVAGRPAGANAPRRRPYHLAMLASFLAANFAIVLPSTWAYCVEYVRGGYSAHHGYLYDGQVYVNAATVLWHGVPWTYYLHMLATKTPLVIAAGAVAGAVAISTRAGERGSVWLRVLILIQLLGYSVVAAKFQRYALPILIPIDILAAVGLVALARWTWPQVRDTAWYVPVAAGMAAAMLSLAVVPLRSAPFYAGYRNLFGAAMAAPLTAFPEEAYDYGVREAVARIAMTAAPGATIVSDAPMVVDYYLGRAGRRDLFARSLSQHGLRAGGEQWVLVQDSHVYFENEAQIAQLRQRLTPSMQYTIGGTPVLQIFRMPF